MGKKVRFTQQQKRDIIHKYTDLEYDMEKIGRYYNCSGKVIKRVLRNNNIKTRGVAYPISGEQENQIISLYENGISLSGIVQEMGLSCSEQVIRNCLANNDIEIKGRGPYRIYNFNHNLFKKRTEASCYWGGFLLADGNICEGNHGAPEISIELQKDDIDHLKKFLKFMNSNAPIESRIFEQGYESRRVRIRSEIVAEDLKKFGVVPRKTHIAKIPRDLIPCVPYWRGVIDGDGFLSSYSDYDTVVISLCNGSKGVVKGFTDFLKYHGLNGNNKIRDANKANAYLYSVGGKEAIKIIELLYNSANIYLGRKYQKAQELVGGVL